jgi:hypothetical protein
MKTDEHRYGFEYCIFWDAVNVCKEEIGIVLSKAFCFFKEKSILNFKTQYTL